VTNLDTMHTCVHDFADILNVKNYFKNLALVCVIENSAMSLHFSWLNDIAIPSGYKRYLCPGNWTRWQLLWLVESRLKGRWRVASVLPTCRAPEASCAKLKSTPTIARPVCSLNLPHGGATRLHLHTKQQLVK